MLDSQIQTIATETGETLEMATLLFHGRSYTALGSRIDAVGGYASGYVSRVCAEGATLPSFHLVTWGGDPIAPLEMTGSYLARGFNGSRFTVYCWRMRFGGLTYSGRNAGPEMHVRMRAKAKGASK